LKSTDGLWLLANALVCFIFTAILLVKEDLLGASLMLGASIFNLGGFFYIRIIKIKNELTV